MEPMTADQTDRERIAVLESQMRDVKDDIAEIKADTGSTKGRVNALVWAVMVAAVALTGNAVVLLLTLGSKP